MDEEEIYAGCSRLRLQLADWLETLRPQELESPSLCSDWTVREVVGHLVAGLHVGTSELVREVIRQRLRIDRANTVLARRAAAQPVDVLLSRLREHAGKRLKVPIVGVHGPLVDLLVHGGDMRLPLAVALPAETELTIEALERLVQGLPGLVPRSRLKGLSLLATDAARSWGHGPVVEGQANDLLMAVCGRRATLPRLRGPGAPTLAQRLS